MIYYLIIGIYLIGLLLIGFSKSDSIKNQEDFSVAGRSLSPWILVGTMAATWMGTGSVLGNAGKTFEIGAAGFLLPIGGMLTAIFVGWVCGSGEAQKEIESLSGRLANKNFVDKAPKNVVEECRANLTESEAQVRLVKERLMGLD